jgi:hypothetical protein
MIPYILAAVGGYLIGQARKDQQYSDGGKVWTIGEYQTIEDWNSTTKKDGSKTTTSAEGYPIRKNGVNVYVVKSKKEAIEKVKRLNSKMADGGLITLWKIENDKATKLKTGTRRAIQSYITKNNLTDRASGENWGLESWDASATEAEVLKYNREYAKGGVLEHGFRKGDTIVSEMANYAGVLNDETGEAALINIETGERIVQ